MSCCIHYAIGEGKLQPLEKCNFDRLKEAKEARKELGGKKLHLKQGLRLEVFNEGMFYHMNCYKKYTMAISVLAKKNKNEGGTEGSSRTKRTGNLGRHLFPDYCMIRKKSGVIKVKSERQLPKKLDLQSAEETIREAARLKGDDVMLGAIEGVSSLLAAEFRVHEKCRRSYTRICPPKSKRVRVDERLIDELRGGIDDSLSTVNDAEMTDKIVDDNSIEIGDDISNEGDDVNFDEFFATEENEKLKDVNYSKGNYELFNFVDLNILSFAQSVSVKLLTDKFGLDGHDRRARHYVKKLIKSRYKEKIIFMTVFKNKPQIAIKYDEHCSGEVEEESNKEYMLQKVARILQDDILLFLTSEKEIPATRPPTTNSLSATRGRYPSSLKLFFTSLVKNKSHLAGDKVVRAIDSMCDDVISSISNGKVLTLKHILVGCGIHSMTGQRKPLDILYRLNNSCSYDIARGINTAQAELAQELSKQQFVSITTYP